jgi:hypothetical protein
MMHHWLRGYSLFTPFHKELNPERMMEHGGFIWTKLEDRMPYKVWTGLRLPMRPSADVGRRVSECLGEQLGAGGGAHI